MAAVLSSALGNRALRLAGTLCFVVGAAWLLAACHGGPHIHQLTVTTTVDGVDALPGDGVCEMTPGVGDCSLRAAVTEARHTRVANIYVPPGEYALTLPGVDDENAGGDLDVRPTVPLRIYSDGSGASVDAAGLDGVFDIRGVLTTIEHIGIRGGSGYGLRVTPGLLVPDVDLVLTRSSVHGNAGAGIVVEAGARLEADNSTVSTNGGVGLHADGDVTMRFVTITQNGGGGIAGAGVPAVHGSIVGAQTSGPDCATPLHPVSDHNVVSDTTCGLVASGNASGTAPQLEPLSTDAVPAHALQQGSPALDAVALANCPVGTLDQRGTARPVGLSCDRGAIESDLGSDSFVVDTQADELDANPGDLVCATASGQCSLRAAITETNALPPGTTGHVLLAVDVPLTRAGADEDGNLTGDFDITHSVSIDGAGHTVVAFNLDRVFHHLGGELSLERVTIAGGRAPTGGGIRIEPGAVATVSDSTIQANQSTGTFTCHNTDPFELPTHCFGEGGGAGIWNAGHLDLVRSTVRDNKAVNGFCGVTGNFLTVCGWSEGAGVLMNTGSIVNSTISGNTADLGSGAGVSVRGSLVPVVHSTIANNTVTHDSTVGFFKVHQITSCCNAFAWATFPGGGRAVLTGSVVTGQEPLCAEVLSEGYNVTADATCGSSPTDVVDADVLLDHLGDYGGATPTHRLQPGSPAVDRVPAGTPGLCDGTVDHDQRGVARPVGAGCDSGSYELENAVALLPVAWSLVRRRRRRVGDASCQDAVDDPAHARRPPA